MPEETWTWKGVLRSILAIISFVIIKVGFKAFLFYLILNAPHPNLFTIALMPFLVYHVLMFVSPVYSLFLFLFVIIGLAAILITLGINYIGFIFISIYGGAILVLFVLVCMLFNKQETILR